MIVVNHNEHADHPHDDNDAQAEEPGRGARKEGGKDLGHGHGAEGPHSGDNDDGDDGDDDDGDYEDVDIAVDDYDDYAGHGAEGPHTGDHHDSNSHQSSMTMCQCHFQSKRKSIYILAYMPTI